MRKCILLLLFLMGWGIESRGQNTPHPQHIMKYYFTAVEGTKQSVVPPSNYAKLRAFKSPNYFSCFPNEGLNFNQFLSQNQMGFDTIYAIQEMLSSGPFLAATMEITNGEYKIFLADSHWIKETLGFNVKQLYPDTSVWLDIPANPERSAVLNPNKVFYFQSTAYNNYPVVGVSQIQATAYCDWLVHKLISAPEHKDLQNWLNKNQLNFSIDLPTAAEWMYLYQACIQEPSRKLVATNKIKGDYFRLNQMRSGALLTFLHHQEIKGVPVAYAGTNTIRGFNIQNEISESLTKPLAGDCFPAKPYPAVSHLLGNVAEWTCTPAYGHLYNNKTTILNTNGQLIENAYQQLNVFDLKGYLVNATDLEHHFAIKGGSWSQDFHYLDPMSVFFMQSNHSSHSVGFRTVVHFYETK